MHKVDLSDLIGKPFRKGATGDAYDCYTLCREVCRRVGIELPKPKRYVESIVKRSGLFPKGKQLCKRLKKPEPFCIVAFSMIRPYITHLGMVLPGCKRFIHILRKAKVCIERLDDPLWSERVEGFYEYIG